MSSFCSSWDTTTSSGSLFPSMSSFLLRPISDADFMSFHEIHRKLFLLLIFSLCRDANKSMLVMAFWMWLDVESYCSPTRFVNKLLNNLSPPKVSLVADETLICLRCIQDENFTFSGSDKEISNLQNLMEAKRLSLGFLCQNQVRILSNVMTLLDEVCWRAFKDILQATFGDSFIFNNLNEGSSSSNSTSTGISTSTLPVIGMPFYPSNVVPQLEIPEMTQFSPNSGFGRGMSMPHFVHNIGDLHRLGALGVPNHAVVPSHVVPYVHQRENIGINALNELQSRQNQHREFTNRELELGKGHVHISEPREEQVPADDRTLFLTFSKGFPLSEIEVRNFFTRRFGDFIEAIIMQEVKPGDQVLYARLVARQQSDIYRIIRNPIEKQMFNINRKHVVVRKFVRNNTPRTPSEVFRFVKW